MLGLCNVGTRLCDGLTRREFLRAGGLALSGLTLPSLLRARARTPAKQGRARSCIVLFMWGGPSQLETFDLKPNAPEGIRGEFKPIATRVPGTHICEHLPRLARMADKYAIIRSLTHPGVNHGTSAYHMLTGHIHPNAGPGQKASPTDHPSLGCAVARFGRQPGDMPAHVALPRLLIEADGRTVPGQAAGILGQSYEPFWMFGDPTRPDFSLDTLTLPDEVSPQRFGTRVSLHSALTRQGEEARKLPDGMDSYYERAFGLLRSPRAQRAFRLAGEPDRVRGRYGWHHFGQSCLLARRLVEAEVPLVTVFWNTGAAGDPGNWDTHDNNFDRLKNLLLPPFEQAYTALLEDLEGRGLLEETLVVWMGEFGRTPKLNRKAGRDHWGMCQSVLLAGAGTRGGQVYGSSDATAAYAAELPVSPDDLAATVFQRLGITLDQEVLDAQGRPQPLCKGTPLNALF